MKKTILPISLLLFGFSIHAQVLVSDPDRDASNPCDCATTFSNNATINFFDTGGGGSNYGNNENEVITFCPDGDGSKITLFFGMGAGFNWDVDPSDTLKVYDGPSITSPLLVAANNNTHPTGISTGVTTASWANTSGCLTVQFISDAANTGTGWDGNVSCANPWQPMELHTGAYIGVGEANGAGDLVDDMTDKHITTAQPDTGYVNVCLGDSVMLVNRTLYPYEPGQPMGAASGGGYNQSNPGNHTTLWEFSDGSSITGDTVWFIPTQRIGYLASMKVTDSQQQFKTIYSKIRVSTIPSFEDCRPVDDEFCLGQATRLIGGIIPGDTAGVDAVGSSFSAPNLFGEQLFLPDGSGQNYVTQLDIAGFTPGLTVQNAGDLISLCVSIEHSYLGDLEMSLTCPNGQSVMIFNSYTGTGLYPGGFGGGGTYLGGANDISSQLGVCELYCFSDDASALPAWVNGYGTTPATGVSTGNMVTPGTYHPEQSFISQLSGCPINGAWTLTVRDNIGADDGWICSWELNFDASLYPPEEYYTPVITSEFWQPDPTIIFGQNDTSVVVAPTTLGVHGYTFEVEDNFGCSYDTTITVNVKPGPSIIPGTPTCDDFFQFSNTYAPSQGGMSGGHWFYEGPGNLTFSPSSTFINPNVTVDTDGDYTLYFNDNVCNDTVSTTISFLSDPVATLFAVDTICQNDTAKFYTFSNFGENYTWYDPFGLLISSDTVAYGTIPGEYTLIASNQCSTDSAKVNLVVQACSIPNVITPNNDGVNDAFYTQYAVVFDDVSLIIFNRWGKVVFKTDSYDNTWEGEKKNGSQVSDGVYFYVMKWDNGSKEESGNITVFGK